MYIDGFVAAVPTANKDAYLAHAKAAWPLFKRSGAVRMVEGWGDDVPDGTLTSFPMAVKKRDDETVVFSWVLWPDKATRDAGWQAIMADEAMKSMAMPFDGKRMIYGGFSPILDVS